jgi:hypothetical protein
LITLVPVVISEVSDLIPVWRNSRVDVRTFSVSEGSDVAGIERELVDLGIPRLVFPIGVAVGGKDESHNVRSPDRRRDMIEVSGGHLPGRATFSGKDEQVVITVFQIAVTVRAVLELRAYG